MTILILPHFWVHLGWSVLSSFPFSKDQRFSKGFMWGELAGHSAFSQKEIRLTLHNCCVFREVWAGAPSCIKIALDMFSIFWPWKWTLFYASDIPQTRRSFFIFRQHSKNYWAFVYIQLSGVKRELDGYSCPKQLLWGETGSFPGWKIGMIFRLNSIILAVGGLSYLKGTPSEHNTFLQSSVVQLRLTLQNFNLSLSVFHLFCIAFVIKKVWPWVNWSNTDVLNFSRLIHLSSSNSLTSDEWTDDAFLRDQVRSIFAILVSFSVVRAFTISRTFAEFEILNTGFVGNDVHYVKLTPDKVKI